MGWDAALMHLDVDGLSVNLKFQDDFKKHFEETAGEEFLDAFQERSVCSSNWPVCCELTWIFLDYLQHTEDYVKVGRLTEVNSKYVFAIHLLDGSV